MGERLPPFIKPAEEGRLIGYTEAPDQEVIERYERDLKRIPKRVS